MEEAVDTEMAGNTNAQQLGGKAVPLAAYYPDLCLELGNKNPTNGEEASDNALSRKDNTTKTSSMLMIEDKSA
jgi:hypothetical protein